MFGSFLVDLIVLLALAYYAFHGYRRGFLLIFLELGFFLAALGIAVGLHRAAAGALSAAFGVSELVGRPLCLLSIWVVAQTAGIVALRSIANRIPDEIHFAAVNRFAGAAVSCAQGLVLVSLLLLLSVVAPVAHTPREWILRSASGSVLVEQAARAERGLARLIGNAVQDSFTFFTVRPDTNERVDLRFATTQFSPSPEAEAELLALINRERTQRGLAPLVPDENLRAAARAHSADMLLHGYFSHTSLDGLSPFDRMRRAGARFNTAGENLALAPTVNMVHRGLMNSPGHRANILNRGFTRVGIGALDAGIYGLMVTQNFAG